VITTARTLGSAAQSAIAAFNASVSASLKAFSTSGRFRVRTVTAPARPTCSGERLVTFP